MVSSTGSRNPSRRAETIAARKFEGTSHEARGGQAAVVCYGPAEDFNPHSHDCVTRTLLAQKLAALKGCSFAGEYEHGRDYSDTLYFVPSRTMVGIETAAALGIAGEHDLFGGVVPYAFVGTKTITHPLADERARAPHGWTHAFAADVAHAVLEGYSAFSLEDAARAGARLLRSGAVRIKPAQGVGGRGQTVVTDEEALRTVLAELDNAELALCGVSLEQNLTEVKTYSVGQVCVGNLVATYHGTQSLTTDNRGAQVYGGSDLMVVRGGFDALLALELSEDAQRAVMHAQVYDDAAHARFAGFFASRRNYDIVQGRDAAGRIRSGVLEQSWRAGGASGAEIAALEHFRADPEARAAHAWCREIYGENAPPPPVDATVYFRGRDEEVGYITKYTRVEDANP